MSDLMIVLSVIMSGIAVFANGTDHKATACFFMSFATWIVGIAIFIR